MTYTNSQPWWEFDQFQPQPQLDSQLLEQIGFIPGFKELLMLRQVHALEHATIWTLSQDQDNESLGGLSTDQGFYLYGQVSPLELQRSVARALGRLQGGEWRLALHPRCGTNLSVAMLLTATVVIGTNLILPKEPISQLLGLGIAATTAMQIAPDLGTTVQRYLTTAIPFNLKLVNITSTKDFWGKKAQFVRLAWQDLPN